MTEPIKIQAAARPSATTGTILPGDMASALEGREGLKVLSLDCFDTLIWRDCHRPVDIFAQLPGVTAHQRGWAEARARKASRMARQRNEVSIGEIYAELMPNASQSAREAAVAAEIACEARHCFAFAPTVALMEEARRRGLKVVLVSDTYFDRAQLRQLIRASAGEAVAGLVDTIFCSSAFGKAKAEGMYGEVLKKLGCKGEAILHIGDNHAADVGGVAPFGVHTLHLHQFTEATRQRLRLESAMGAMLHDQRGERMAGAQVHRAAIALAEPDIGDEAGRLGLTTLGPVFHAFEDWLQAEAEGLAAGGGKVHWLFLMRDGHLPLRVHAARTGRSEDGHALEISRFIATAASFTSRDKVNAFLAHELGLNPTTLARQLLVGDEDYARIVGTGCDPQEASLALWQALRGPAMGKEIVAASRALSDRLVAHVRATCDPQAGDTLMLVDLGYNGSVQNEIDALLARELGVHVAGRYLLLHELSRPGLDKRGLIDARHYDPHALSALTANVALLEQLATCARGTVVDYTSQGEPIRAENDIKGQQSAVREAIQLGCLAYGAAQERASLRVAPAPDAEHLWRESATAVLARLFFHPLAIELAQIARFEHDVNIGSQRKVALFDPEVARTGMKERGLFYLTDSERMYLPGELHGLGLANRLTYFSSQRFGLPLTFADFSEGALTLPVIYVDGAQTIPSQVQAYPTHDGYYFAAVPIGACRYSVALQLGTLAQWIELSSLGVVPFEEVMAGEKAGKAAPIAVQATLDGIAVMGEGLLRCETPAGLMLVERPQVNADRPMALALVLRPIAPFASDAGECAAAKGVNPRVSERMVAS